MHLNKLHFEFVKLEVELEIGRGVPVQDTQADAARANRVR